MRISLLSERVKTAFGKFWRAYIVDECPEEDWELFEGREISPKNAPYPAVSGQAPLPSYHFSARGLHPELMDKLRGYGLRHHFVSGIKSLGLHDGQSDSMQALGSILVRWRALACKPRSPPRA